VEHNLHPLHFIGYELIAHGGYWPPYESGFYLFPAKEMGIFLSRNGPGYTLSLVNLDVVADAIFQIITSPDSSKLTQRITRLKLN